MNMTDDNMKKIDAKITREMEAPKLDITPYVNVDTKIATYEIGEKKFKDKNGEDKPSFFATFYTEKLGETPEGTPIHATKQFGLKRDAESGEIGWSSAGNLAKYLKAKGKNHPDDLIGMDVTTKRSEPDANGQEWLTF